MTIQYHGLPLSTTTEPQIDELLPHTDDAIPSTELVDEKPNLWESRLPADGQDEFARYFQHYPYTHPGWLLSQPWGARALNNTPNVEYTSPASSTTRFDQGPPLVPSWFEGREGLGEEGVRECNGLPAFVPPQMKKRRRQEDGSSALEEVMEYNALELRKADLELHVAKMEHELVCEEGGLADLVAAAKRKQAVSYLRVEIARLEWKMVDMRCKRRLRTGQLEV
ncbi:hypothetical protein NA57DRAFT_59196 [Rhizodiscina lignyota]|uniref:Uncharacterized protein n=1 Tax=Rhizodiscina lignyota TaxID=1504668 RepID=A0A9P4I9W4_9PEZI|nr:hypothetical protein NA57DRAFT_59196 [Rhizodiscina lignyota]